MSAPANPQAYPCLDSSCGELSMRDPGMTLRDYFAGQALGSAMAYAFANLDNPFLRDYLPEEYAVKIAFDMADAMLAARGKVQS